MQAALHPSTSQSSVFYLLIFKSEIVHCVLLTTRKNGRTENGQFISEVLVETSEITCYMLVSFSDVDINLLVGGNNSLAVDQTSKLGHSLCFDNTLLYIRKHLRVNKISYVNKRC